MIYHLTFSIAGLLVKVDSEVDFERFRDIDELSAFKSQVRQQPACRLFLKNGLPRRLGNGKKQLFNPADNWKFFRTEKGFMVEIGVPDSKGRPHEIVDFSSDFKRGTIYKKKIVEFSRYFLDQFLLINLLSRHKGFVLHAGGLIWEKKGLVFSGRSGIGKSTLLRLFGARIDKTELLNDDRIIVRKCGRKWSIFGTPWHGDFPVVSSRQAPLGAICFIKQASANSLRPLSNVETCEALFKHSLLPYWDETGMKGALDTFKLLTQEYPAYELGVVPDQSAVDFITSKF